MQMEYLFVYGTLLKYFNNEVMQSLKNSLEYLSHGELQGRLIDLGEYPALIEDTTGNVKGEVYRVADTDKVFEVLDEYEGEEYSREKKLVRLDTNNKIRCWVYVYRQKPKPEHEKIMSGDYIAFIRNKG